MNTEPLCSHHSNGVLFSESKLLYCIQVYEVTHAVGDLPLLPEWIKRVQVNQPYNDHTVWDRI